MGFRWGAAAFAVAVALASAQASAKPVAETARVLESQADSRRHLVYGEAGGKFGLYGVGYELALSERFHVGAAGTAYAAGSRTTIATSLYVGIGAAFSGRHRWFAQLGPQLVRDSEPAVPGFDGLSTVGLGAQLSAGYEYRRSRWLLRAHGVVTAGKGGAVPWLGMSLGVRL